MGKRIRRGRDFKNSLASKSQCNLLELTQYLSTGRGDALASAVRKSRVWHLRFINAHQVVSDLNCWLHPADVIKALSVVDLLSSEGQCGFSHPHVYTTYNESELIHKKSCCSSHLAAGTSLILPHHGHRSCTNSPAASHSPESKIKRAT